jgi:DNA-binding PadR family transcriptional regulator
MVGVCVRSARVPGKELKDLLPLTPASVQILLSLSDGVKHGYGIKHEVEARTDGRVLLGAGTLYGAIQRLAAAGLVEEADAPTKSRSDGETARWRFYRLTALGRRVLLEEIRRLEADVRTARAKGLPVGLEEA